MTDLHQLDIDEELSATSSSSSFVPIDKVVFDATQVIDESKQFNGHLIDYIEKTTPIGSIGNNYHIVSVFGSQSTGKSTLLNNLFHTNFDVMDESQRQQTTKGIWLAYSPAINSTMTPTKSSKHKTMGNVFVMDIEGTDGRERGEDQDFERKSALFALSTSEILIINIWEHQIGLYQGANMGLLKTVFEVNLSLFGKNKLAKTDDHKVLLLFVIRDYVGVTPIENLAATVTQDLIKMWDELNKPKELVDLKFEEFFDLKFHTLSHKILQTDKFNHDVKLLGNKFVDDTNEEYLWKDCYHHNIPIDGWTMYASNVWDQIDNNKDLDLPTQQILVAKFKCDEILNSLFTEFQAKYNELLLAKSSDSGDVDYQEIGLLMKDLKGDYLDQFQLLASKYNPSVYQTKKSLLDEKILSKYNELFNIYAKKIISKILKNFKTQLEDKSDKKFIDKVEELTKSSKHELNTNLSLISVNELKFDHFEIELTNDIEELVTKQQIIELNLIINKLIKKLSNQLNKLINFEINDVNIKSWDNIYQGFRNIVDDLLSPYASTEGYDFNLGIDNTTTLHSIESFKFKSWVKFYQLIKKNLSKESILNILKERFDNKFRYDENGIPKLYNNEFELEKNFNDSKTDALKILPQLTLIKLSNATEIVPDYDIFNKELIAKYDENYNINHHDEDDEDDDDFDDDTNKFSHIISETDKTEILNKFKKEIDARYIETKRSIIQLVTSIPYYIYIIIVVLGWNEFLAIIRSPIFFTLLLLFSGIFYAMYQLNLIRPAMVVGQRMVDESITLAKAKLREFLIDDNEFHGKNLKKVSEEIELDDLSDPKKND